MTAAAFDLPNLPPEVAASMRAQMPPAAQHVETLAVTNDEFLKAIFADRTTEEALWACHFTGDPKQDARWKGHGVFGALNDHPEANTYFSVAALKMDERRVYKRRKANFSRLFVVVLDDAMPLAGIDPTWILETSHPGGRSNTQVGYRLAEPLDDAGIADRLHHALGEAGRLSIDTSGNNIVRYVRLPVGSNGKHFPPHAHRLLVWTPEVRVALTDLIDALGLDRDAILNEPVVEPRPEPTRVNGQQHPRSEGGFFRSVNDAALANLSAWAPAIFPQAKPYQGGYRVSSESLGRSLEEDLSLHPTGIKDHGEEHGRTAIDVVLKWGPADTAPEAALWLCAQMGVDPGSLGWRDPSEGIDFSGLTDRATGAAADSETPVVDPSKLDDTSRKVRSALASIPKDASLNRHSAAAVIGLAIKHSDSGIAEDVGAALCAEWDKRVNGGSLAIFRKANPDYQATKPLGLASIFKLARENGGPGGTDADVEENPDSDFLTPPPRPTEAMFYGLVGDVAAAAAQEREVNRVSVAAAFMSWLSAQVGRDTYIQVGDVRHALQLFTLHTGRTAIAAKGESVSLVKRVDAEIRQSLRIPRHSATCSTNIRPAIPPAFGHPFHGHSAGAVGAKRRRWVIVTRRVRSASTSGRGVCASTRL